MTTTLEKKPAETPKKEEPFLGLEPFAPGFIGGLLADMRRMTEEFNPFFEGFGLPRRTGVPALFRKPVPAIWTPNIEVLYVNGAIVVRAELPGIKKEEVKIEIVEGALTVEGERRVHEKEVTKKGYFTTERAYGTFYRRIPLPEEAKVGEAKATFKDGVLEVTIPAPALTKEPARRLEIEGA